MPPYKSSLAPINSVHECPVTKMQMKFSMSRLSHEKKKPSKTRTSNAGNQQRRSKNHGLHYSQIGRNGRFIKQYLEDEIALAKDIFWVERQRIHNEASDKAIKKAKKKCKKFSLNLKTYPRWYQDFSLDQMRNLMQLEYVMRTDYEEPSTIKELYKLCNLNSVDFLREIYRILTGNDFCKEGYKKAYNCNERIILSAIAFLTLPETVKELHKRLPAVVMPRLLPKPKLTCLARRKNSCPYKEELFTRPDWAGYRNALQKWRKQRKLIAIPKVILPLNKYGQFFIDRSEIRGKDISTEHLEEICTKEVHKISSTTCDQKDSSSEGSSEMGKSANFNIFRPTDVSKKIGFIRNLSEKPETVEYKIYGPPKPPGTSQKSWLGKKDAHYVIGGVSTENSHDYPVTYEITDVANVTPSNSDEKFFAVLKLSDQTRKVFPSGRENLSINWQEWLQNADENYRQLEEETDELIKSVQTIIKSAFPGPVCDSCCSCRETKKFDEKQNKISKMLIDIAQDEEKNIHMADSMAMQSSGQNPTESPINHAASKNEIKTNLIINGISKETGQTQYYMSDIQKDKIHVPRMPEPPALQPIKNVPSCLCAIQQMVNNNISLSTNKEDISWTKEEGLCPGKKYKPNEPGAYSCKTYPGDKFCRHNPFIKEIMKMERRKIEKRIEGGGEAKEKTEFIEVVKKETQISKMDIKERKKDKFIPNPDYPAYDDLWNIARTAPSVKTMKSDYEATLNLTPPAWPTITSSLKMQEKQNDMCISETMDKRLKLIEKYSGSKSLVENIRKKPKSCNCNDVITKEDRLVEQMKDLEDTRKKLIESKLPEERWKIALKDAPLTDYFTQHDTNVPCWTSCKKIARHARPRRLKIVKPVCECKYERKILERNEERAKWKAHQQRLKALKKQSFMHIVDTSRLMIEDKKLFTSDVNKIPQKNEKDDIKNCILGVAKNIFTSPPQKIIDGVKMSTPFQTPSSSEETILRTAILHRHWSPMSIPPGPLPRKDTALKKEMERRKKARDEAFKLIYGDKNEQDASCLMTRNDREAYDEQKSVKKDDKRKDDINESHTNIKKETSNRIIKLQSLSKKTNSKIGRRRDASHKEITGKVVRENKYSKQVVDGVDRQQNVSYKQAIEKNDDGNYRLNGGSDKKYVNNKSDLIAIMKAELKKMAAEGYTFAKLPECYLMPQLQDWIMYREGVAFSETDKKNLMRATHTMWELISMQEHLKIRKPSLHMTKHQLKDLTYDQVERMKRKIGKTRAIFHNKVRKSRVSYARMLWGTMEHGKFPSTSFKRTFFTYMPSKKADGHVYKPWLPSEICKQDPNFCCW